MQNLPSTFGQTEKAVIYLRVSTEEQVDNYSLETQESICRKEAEKRKLEVAQIFKDEGRSAKTIDGRPALIEMLEFCRQHKKEVRAVIIYRLDRISRQTADYLAIRKKLVECDIKLISATEPTGSSPTEKFIETMLAGFAQMDNDVRSERSKTGMKARFMSGLSNGFVPIGYLIRDGYPVKDPATFDLIKKAWDLMETGTKTLKEVAEILRNEGVEGGRRNGRQGIIRAQTLSKIFKNKFYLGKIYSKKYNLEIQGQQTAMITEEQFYKVQSILDGRNVNISKPLARRNVDNPDFPLRRIVKCNTCGASLTAGWCTGKNKNKRYAYYFCPHRCKGMNTGGSKIDEKTIQKLDAIKPEENTGNLFNAWLRSKYKERFSTLEKRREVADTELKKLYDFRQVLIQKNISGVYSDEIFKDQNRIVEGKIQALNVTKNDDLIQKYNLEAITIFVKTKLVNITETYLKADLKQKRTLMCSIYPNGLRWDGNDYLKTEISPFWTGLLAFQRKPILIGTRGGSRTPDFLDRNQALYPLSYAGKFFSNPLPRPKRREATRAKIVYRTRFTTETILLFELIIAEVCEIFQLLDWQKFGRILRHKKRGGLWHYTIHIIQTKARERRA